MSYCGVLCRASLWGGIKRVGVKTEQVCNKRNWARDYWQVSLYRRVTYFLEIIITMFKLRYLYKTIAMIALLLVAGLSAYGLSYLKRLGPIPAGYVSHTICSGIFIAGRDYNDIYATDISQLQRRLTRTQIDGNTVITQFGFWPIEYISKTVFRPGLGCARLEGDEIVDLEGPAFLELNIVATAQQNLAWPEFVNAPTGVNTAKLNAAMDRAFSDTAINYEERQNTRAVVIFYKGQLIAERYAEGFGPQVPLNSWSMTKSATSALVGILVGRGQIDLANTSGLQGWDNPADLRSQVTVEHLLQMTSGLEFNEGYEEDPISDVNFMLMKAQNLTTFASQYSVTAEPGTRWAYQTASPVLLGRIIRDSFTSEEAYHHFPQSALFNKLGMENAHYQMDGGGTYVGGAFLYATARDWARFGLMYLNNGVVNGEQILPKGWVEFSTNATEASKKARAYAAQFWLNQNSAHRMMPKVPEDAYAARGHYGQSTFIIPSRQLVVVRMGHSFSADAWDMEDFLVDVLGAITD